MYIGDNLNLEIDDKIIIYLRKDKIINLDFNNLDILEKYLKELVIKLNDIYNIKIEGFYNIKVYIDELFGIVLEIEAEDIDYCLSNEIEMRISLFYEKFLYEINDFMNISNTNIIKKGFKYYLECHNNIAYKDYLNILENSQIIYKNTKKIIKYGNVVTYFNLKKSVI